MSKERSTIKEGYKNTTIGVIPEDWEIETLQSVCDVRDGTHDSPKYFDKGVKFITSKNIINGKLDFSELKYISKKDAIEIDKRSKVSKGDIIMSMIGTIGNAVLIDFEPNFSIKNVALFKSKNNLINSKYLIQTFFSDNYQKYIESKLSGGIQKFISLSMLRELEIPLPPLPEQTAIATVLSDTDQLLQALQKKIAKKRLIKKGAMQSLLKPNPDSNREGWVFKSLGDVLSFSGGSQPPRDTFVFKSKKGYIRLLQIRDYKSDKYASYIPSHLANKFCTKEDIMIGRYGPPIFQILRGKEGAYNVALMKAIPNSMITKDYSWHFLNQEKLFNFVEKLSQRSSGQTGVDLVELRKYPIMLPDIQEQKRIATILSDMDAEIEILEKQLAKYRLIKQGLMQVLLTGKIRLV